MGPDPDSNISLIRDKGGGVSGRRYFIVNEKKWDNYGKIWEGNLKKGKNRYKGEIKARLVKGGEGT